MPKRIVICIDGTRNQFGQRPSNVLRIYDAAIKDQDQLAYYQPGVGTLVPTQVLSKLRNLFLRTFDAATAWMMERHITAPYRWLMRQDIEGADIFVFGFSRGAYAARALCGMLKTVGLLRTDYEEMVPFAFQEYLGAASKEKRFDEFRRLFSRPARCTSWGCGTP